MSTGFSGEWPNLLFSTQAEERQNLVWLQCMETCMQLLNYRFSIMICSVETKKAVVPAQNNFSLSVRQQNAKSSL